MARRHNPALGPMATEDGTDDQSTMAGGAPGVVPQDASDANESAAMSRRTREAEPPPPPPTQFRVVNGAHVMYGGCRTVLRPGKLVDAYSYDLDLLRKQGVVLEEVKA